MSSRTNEQSRGTTVSATGGNDKSVSSTSRRGASCDALYHSAVVCSSPRLPCHALPCPSPTPARDLGRECVREAGPQAPRPQPSGWPRVGMLRCYAAASVCVCGREPPPPSTLPACPHTTPLSVSRPVLRPCCSVAGLAALVPDPCVARSLVSKLPGPPKPTQGYPNLPTISCALLSLPTRRLHSTACRIQGHIPPPTTTGDGSRRGAGLGFWAHEHINERASEPQAHKRAGDG